MPATGSTCPAEERRTYSCRGKLAAVARSTAMRWRDDLSVQMMARFSIRGVGLSYLDVGVGMPMVMQHGLCSDVAELRAALPETVGFRLIALECRGHGNSDLGDPEALSISQFAEDVVALLDHLGVERAVVGGLSMGAAIALRLACRYRERVSALILGRPAWTGEHAPQNLAVFSELVELIRNLGTTLAKESFAQSERLRTIRAFSPHNADSLLDDLDRLDPRVAEALFSRIPRDGPGVSVAELAAIDCPALIIGTDRDAIHPMETACHLASVIPNARLVQIVSKSASCDVHARELKTVLSEFLGALGGMH